ncbi:MAG: hypothetical protein AAF596_01640 [Planctomycetota bacterium]
MDRKHEAAPMWLFGIAVTAAMFTLICLAHQSAKRAHRDRVATLNSSRPAAWPTLGPPPTTREAPRAAANASTAVAGLALLDPLLEQAPEFAAPADVLAFPLAGVSDGDGYDPVASIAPIDLLKPIDDPESAASAGWSPELTELALPSIDFDLGSPEIVVLEPTMPRWRAGAGVDRWSLFAVDTKAAARSAGAVLARLSNRLPEQTRKAADAADALVAQIVRQKSDGVIIHSPPALAGPIVESSDDRLAMAVSPEPLVAAMDRRRDRAAYDRSRDDVTPPVADADSIAKPVTLLEQVRLLVAEPATSGWAIQVEAALDGVLAVRPGDAEAFSRASRELRRLALEGSDLAELLDSERAAVLLRRACYGIFRRLAAWDLAAAVDGRQSSAALGLRSLQTAPGAMDPKAMDKWRVIAACLHGDTQDPLAGQGLRWPIRRDVHVMPASLFSWRSPPVPSWPSTNPGRSAWSLVSRIEAYEAGGDPELAATLAGQLQELRDSDAPDERRLANRVDGQYRNANLRLAIADELIERLLPSQTKATTPVRERVLGADVRGVATTRSTLSVKLTPDAGRWKISLESRGSVATRTRSASGPVVLHSEGATRFVAQKPIEVNSGGVAFAAARCEANNSSRLIRVDSSVDRVPVVRRVVRSRAQEEYAQSRAAVSRQAEQRVERRVAQALDTRTTEMVGRLRQRYQEQVVERAEALGMRVTPLEVRTTDRRLIARVRLASDGQLGSHTPRNRAPSDSLASLQLHESAINNAAAGLELSGRRFTPATLREHLATCLHAPALAEGDVENPSAELVFADEQPVSIRIGDGQARLTLALAEMRIGKSRYRDFKVHASYEPEPTGVSAVVRRTGTLEIEGRMKTASRLRLHGVFGKVLSEQRPITLLAPPEGDTRFDDLMITQMIMDDGWLGLAVGPVDHPGIAGRRLAVAGRYLR